MVLQIEGMTIDADKVASMENKRFKVIEKPIYKDYEEDDGRGNKKFNRKLFLKVELSNGEVYEYYPNKTSIKAMVKLYGSDAEQFKDKFFQWIVATGMYQGNIRKFLYVEALVINRFFEEIKI
jgi:hypothetical protein